MLTTVKWITEKQQQLGMSKWYYHKQQDNKWTYSCVCANWLTFLSTFSHRNFIYIYVMYNSNMHVSKVILNIKRVLEWLTTATLDKFTAKRPDKINSRHVKIVRYLQSWNAMSIDFEQRISHNAFRLLYARETKPYSQTHTSNLGAHYGIKQNFLGIWFKHAYKMTAFILWLLLWYSFINPL